MHSHARGGQRANGGEQQLSPVAHVAAERQKDLPLEVRDDA